MSQDSQNSPSHRSLFESLEERVLFDGVPDAQFFIPQTDSGNPAPAQVQDADIADSGQQVELIFVDPGVEDSDALLSEILESRSDRTFEIRVLDGGQDGIQQITEILSQAETKYDAIHIISHGDDGQVHLGNTTLQYDNLSNYADELSSWSSALTEEADLLFYGCDLASTADGKSLIESISAVTGADVAASDDITGAADQGGDWDLEFTSGIVTAQTLAAYQYTGTLALADATLSIVSDGTPVWDTDNNAGNDTDGSNGIIRTHDTIVMEVFYNTDAAGATDLHFTSTLPDGLVFDNLPAAAALDSRSNISADGRTITAYLPDVAGTFTSSVTFEARALGGAQGTPLNDVQFEVHSNENATSLVTEDFDFVLSSAANMDIELLAPTFRGVYTDASGTVDGVVYSYGIGIFGAHPTRTGSDGVKGSAPIEDNFTFDIDLTDVTPNSQVFTWGPSLGAASDNADDGLTRNYERFVNVAGNDETAWSNSSRPSGQLNEGPSAVWSEERSTPDSGDWNITGSTGTVFSAEVSGADTTGSYFPGRTAANRVIPASDFWFTSSMVHVWIPIDDILPGEDGIVGTADDNLLAVTPKLTNFDPDDAFGITNNFGDGATEDTSNNERTHTIRSFSLGGSTKHNSEAGHPTSGRWVSTATQFSSGDAETSVGHIYDARVSSGRNQGVLTLPGVIFGDKFDNSATKIVANSLPSESGDGWSRAYSSGGPFSGSHLTYGVDYIIEFGTGGVDADPAGWTDWDSMGDATLADDQSIGGYWSADPTDVNLGGNAYADGVRDSISKWRITMLRDLEPGENVIGLVSMETVGHSTLDLGINPGGNIIANFNASSVGFLRDNANPDDDWRGSEYDPLTNSFYSGGVAGDVDRGDRLWIVDANVDVDKTVIDLGAGNNYLAGSAATIQLEGTVTIPGPDDGSPAQDVYITDLLPAGLTVVGGSATPAAGFSYVAGDGSTQTVQSVEYWDGTSWSTTWTYGASGIRWYYGDVPLNTALPTMTFDVLIPFDAKNGESWTNTAVASSPSDDSTEEFRNSSAGLVAVQVAAMSAGKFVVTPLVPEDTTIIYELGIANVSDDKEVPWFDLVDVLPYDADFEGSSINGSYSFIDVTGLDPGLEVYVTSTLASTLDAADGTVDGYADPGTAAAGDAWFVAEGTGIWTYTLADVQAGVAGAPTVDQVTAIRVVSDKAIDPYLDPGESTKFFLELTPDGNVGIPSDHYTNKFAARTDPGALPLPVTSAAVTAVVVAPDIEIEKEVALDETHVNIDPTNDAHWGETVNFDDTDKAYFRLKVTNTGTADFLGATVTDSLPAGATFVAGTTVASGGDFSGFPATWTFDLTAGDTAYLIYQLDVNDSGNYVNSADVEATDQFGETVDDTDDAEANFVTEISAAKQQTNAVRSTTNPDLFEVTYEVEVMNTSIFDLAQITLTEDLVGAFGPGFQGIVNAPVITSSSISAGGTSPTINGSYNGAGDTAVLNADGYLLPTDSITITYTVHVDPALLPNPSGTVNQVEAGGITGGPGGTPTTDLSDDGSDPDSDNPGARGDDGMGGTDDPTPLILPSIDLTKQIVGSPVPASSGVNGNFDVTYEFMIENTGTTDLNNISMIEDFIANLGGAFQGIVNGPRVTMTTATDSPDFNTDYDGSTDTDIFNNTPTVTPWTFGGNPTSTTIDNVSYFGDQFYVIDPNQTYTLTADAFAGDGAGGNYDPASGTFLGFASYDIDGRLIGLYNYAKHSGAVDTTLAAPLNPGDTTITLADATGWQNAGAGFQRAIAWYGYTDSTGFTYADYDYTRNFLANGWDPGAISGNTITLTNPWAGPALAAGDAVRNATSGGTYQYSLLSNAHIDETGGTYSADIGGGFISNAGGGQNLWRPGTHSIRALVLADWRSGGTDTQINVSNFQITAPNENLLEAGQKVTFEITVEIDPDAPGAIYDGITVDGDGSLENQASVTAEDPYNGIPVADTSDDPTDPTDAEYGDDSDPDDPTSLLFPNIELTKAIVGTPVPASSGATGNMDVTFEFVITNSGNEALEDISLLEDLLTQYGGAFQGIVPQGTAPAVVTFSDATDPVEINPNFDGGASDAELIDSSTTNELAMGQTIRIQIVVEVDPDNATALYTSGMLVNQAAVTGVGTTSGIVTDDESDDPNDSTNSDNDADNDPDDPTTWAIPVIDLTKTLVGDPVAASSGTQGNFDVTYDFTISNFGNAPMDMLSLQEDVLAQYGTAFVAIVPQSGIQATIQSSSMTNPPEINASYDGGISDAEVFDNSGSNINLIAMGQSVTIRIVFEVDPNAVGANFDANNNLVNQATVSGNHDGTTYTDASDDPNNSDDVDPNGDNNADDPNTLFIADVSIAKEVVGTPVPTASGNFEVTYQLVVENTGNASLDISLEDDLDAQFGAAFVGAGGLTMITQPAGNPITLDSANWDGDVVTEMVNQTQTNILAGGEFFIVQFTVEVDPDATGTSQALNNQATVSGDAVDENGLPLTDSNGDPVVVDDLSDTGSDPETNNPGENGDSGGSDDPTPLLLPDVAIAKSIVGDPVQIANGNFVVQYQFVVENIGTTYLSNLQVVEDFAAEFGANVFVQIVAPPVVNVLPTDPSSVAPNRNVAYDGNADANLLDGTSGLLAPGDSYTVGVTVELDPNGAGAIVPFENTAVTTGDAANPDGSPITDGSGDPIVVTDDSDSGTNPNTNNAGEPGDTGGTDDPTPLFIADLDITKAIVGGPTLLSNGNHAIDYSVVVENTGSVDLANLSLIEDLQAQFGAGFQNATGLSIGTAPSDPSSTVTLESSWDGTTALSEMVDSGAASLLAIGDSFTITFTVEVDASSLPTATAPIVYTSEAAFASATKATLREDFTDIVGNTPVDLSLGPFVSNLGGVEISGTIVSSVGTGAETRVDENSFSGGAPDPGVFAIRQSDGGSANLRITVPNPGNAIGFVWSDVFDPAGGAPAGQWTYFKATASDGTVLFEHDERTDGDLPSNFARFIGIQGTGSQVYTHIDIEFETSGNDNWTIDHIYDSGNANNVITNQIDGSGDAVDDMGNPINDSNGNPITVTDESDSGGDPDDENSGDPGNSGGQNDPTPLVIPEVSLAKDAGDAVANGDNWDVEFTLFYENTGNADLYNLTLYDDIAAQFGNAFVSVNGVAVQNFVGTGVPPTANAAWESDTTLNMLSVMTAGTADVGDSFEVVFIVTIDPDGLDSISQALDNTAVAGGDALDENGDPILDGSGNPVMVSDESDDGTDVNGENGEDNGDGTFGNDPTPIIIADVAVAKQVVAQPTQLANGNFEATYQLVIENTGTVDLANFSLDDDIAAQFGTQFVDAYGLSMITGPTDPGSSITLDSANWDGDGVSEMVNTALAANLAIGDSFVVQFSVEIDPDAGGTASAPLENQVTAGGTGVDDSGTPYTDSNGDPILASDLSDDGTDPSTDNAGSPGDHGTTDDPTPVYIPAIGLAKQAGDAVANGDNFDVTFTFVVENTGTVDLNNLDLEDDIAAEFGNAWVSASGLTVQNFVGSGTAPGANATWESDTTLNMLDGTGQLNVGDSFEVVFTVTIDPDGIDSVSQNLENQGTITGVALDENGDPIDDGSGGTLQANDDSDNGTDPNGENGEDDGDGTFGNDPTPIVIADISVAKEVVGTPVQLANDNFSVTYQLVIENTGTVDLADLTLVDDMANQFGNAFVNAGNLTLIAGPSAAGSGIVLDSANWDGDTSVEMINQVLASSLIVGDSFVIQFDVEVDPDATGTSGPMNNQATVAGDAVDSNGDPITDSNGDPIVVDDDSDSGADPSTTNSSGDGDTGGSDDPTPLLLPAMGVGKQANTVVIATDGAGNELTGVFDVQYLVVVENTGTVELTNLQLLDDLTTISTFGDAYDPTVLAGPTDRSGLVTGPAIVSHTMANAGDLPNLNAGFLGGGADTNLFDGTSGALQTGEQIVISFTIRIDADELLDGDATDGLAQNQIQGSADSPQGPVSDDSDDGLNPNDDNGSGGTNDPTPFQVPQIRLWKSHSDRVDNGDGTSTITVQLRIENSGTVDLNNLSLTEDLETQFGAAFISATNPVISVPPNNASSTVPANLINGSWNADTSLDVFDSSINSELLKAGDEFTIEFEVIVDPDLLDDDSDYLANTATVSGDGQNFDGTTIEVTDDSGADDGSGIDSDEPTPAIVPEIAIVKQAGDAVANGDDWDVPFTLVVENTGSVNLNNLTLFDDIASQFGNGYVSTSGLTVQNFVGSGTVPTANSGWAGDTSLTLINGGDLVPGDRFEVTFTVTIDPDGLDSVSQALDNEATVNGDAVDDMGNPLLDENGDQMTADDVSDDGTNPQGTNPGENGDEGTDADPTPIIIADVSIAKEVVGQPSILSNGNFAVTYQLVIENIGTVDLADMTLVDDLQTQFGASVFQSVSGLTMITGPTDPGSSISLDAANWDGTGATDMLDQAVSNDLAIGDIFTIQFTVEVNAGAATGVLDNQAMVGGTGVDENGDVYTDSNGDDITASDDSDSGATTGDDNAGEPGDTGGGDDPTPLYIPDIGLAKDAGDAVANGDDFDVTFSLVWENTGNVALDNVDLMDDIAAQFGNQFVEVVSGSLSVQNFVGSGSAPTANATWEGDTTLSLINSTGPLEVGDTFEVFFTVTIDPDAGGTSSTGLDNQATSTGEALDENGDALTDDSGDPITVTDDSDDGVDPTDENGTNDGDGTFGNDPTPIIIPDIRVVKAVSGNPTELPNGNFDVTYELIIENTGNVDLADLTLIEDLTAHFGSVFESAGNLTLATAPSNANSNVVLDTANWDGDGTTEMINQTAVTLLAVGDSFTVTFTVEVDPDAIGAPPQPYENQVVAGGDAVDSNGDLILDANGDPIEVSDLSDDGTDPNGTNPTAQGDHGTSDDPTPLLIPDVGIAKQAGDAVANGDDWDVSFTLTIENIGTVTLDTLSLADDVAAQFGNAFVSASGLTVQNFAGMGVAPGANAAWNGNTMADMLDGTGSLNVGDSFEVVFTVTIDPDGLDSVSQALENQAEISGNGVNPDGTAMTDASGDPITTSDDSDDGTDVHGENGDDGGDGIANNDPTPIIIADVSAAKQVVGQPTLLANGNFEATYQLVVENVGTVDLANLTLAEDIATQFGAPFVDAYGLTMVTAPADPSSSVVLDLANWNGDSNIELVNTALPSLLAVGDSFVIQFSVEIDAVLASGVLENIVTASGDAVDENGDVINDSNGDPVTATDDSDSGSDPSTDNASDLGDHSTTDDPTPVYIPSIGLAKDAGDAVANGDNFDVTFTLVWENTGTVALDNVDLIDDVAAQFGGQFVGIVPGSLMVQNFVGTGTAPTANAAWETDTTVSAITSAGALEVDDTFEIVFTVTIDPDASGTSSAGLENQATSTGTGLDETGSPLLDGSGDPITVTDVSDDGVDPTAENGEDDMDGVFGNDPTPVIIPDIRVVKEVSGTPTLLSNGNYSVDYQLVIENTGNVDLANLTLVEDLSAHFGTAFVSAGNILLSMPPSDAGSNVVLDSNWDGTASTEMINQIATTTLAVGDEFAVTFTVEVDPDAVGAPGALDNQVVVGGDAVDENGDPIEDSSGNPIVVTDDSDSGADPNGTNAGEDGDMGTSDDPTPLLIPDIGLAKSAADAVANGDNWDITFTFLYENTGTVDLATLSLVDDIEAEFGNAFVSASGLTVQNFVGTGTAPGANAAWEGDTTLDMLDGTGQANIGDSFEVVFTITIDPDGIDSVSQGLENQGTATGVGIHPDTGLPDPDLTVTDDSDSGVDPNGENGEDDGDGTFANDPTPIIIADVSVAKEVVGQPLILSNGNFEVTYQLVVENIGTVDLTDMTLVDDIETQFGASVFQGVSGLTLVTGTSDAFSSITLDPTNWDGTGATDILDQGVSNSLAIGDQFTIQFTVEVDAVAASGILENQAIVEGTSVDDDGNPYLDDNGDEITASDDSDSGATTGDTNSGEPGDMGTSDDPTPTYIPHVGLAKEASDAVANGDNWDVTFTLVWENTGNVDLTNLTMFDNIAAEFGDAYVSASGLAIQNYSGTGTPPTINAAWMADTTQSMISGGTANAGDTFEVVFTITIDPDGIDSVSQSLDNQATTSGEGLDENGDPLLDDNGDPVIASDDSDNGTSASDENGEDDGDGVFGNDPTPIIIADVSVAKAVIGNPTLLSNGNFEAVYELVIENTGTVDLANLSLAEDIATQFGIQYVDAYDLVITTGPSANSSVTLDTSNWDGGSVTEMVDATPSLLVVGDSFVIQFKVEIDPDAGGTATGPLENQVTATGDAVDENGDPINDSNGTPITATDDSDSGTDPSSDNSGDLGDHGTSDDPTPIYIPSIGLAKEAGDASPNGEDWDVTFTFVVENTGTVDLNNLNLIDDIATEFGSAFVSASGLSVGNFVGTGTAPGANLGWQSDTMLNMLDGTGQLNVGDTFEVEFTVTIDPDGIDSVSQSLENQGTITGDGLDENGNPLDDGSGGTLQASDDSDNGTNPNDENGEDGNNDGVYGNDPTPVLIADIAVAKEVFGTPVQLANDNWEVTYQLVVENTGAVDLINLSLLDDLSSQFGPAYINAGSLTLISGPGLAGSNVVLDSANWNGGSNAEMIDQNASTALMVGDSYVVQFTVEIDPDATGTSGPLDNQVSTGGEAVDSLGNPITNSNGDPITATDDSDSGTEPSNSNSGADGDTGGTNDPTPLLLPDLSVGKQANTVVAATDGAGNELTGSFDVQYLVVIENTGTIELTNLQLLDDLTTTSTFGDAYDASLLSGVVDRSGLVTGPAIVSHTLANAGDLPNLNAGFLGGGSQTGLFDGTSGALQVGEQIVVSFTIRVDADEMRDGDALDGMAQNQVQGSADSDQGPVNDDSDNGLNPNTDNGETGTDNPTPFEVPQIRIYKTHSDSVSNADGTSTISVTLRVENNGTVNLNNLSLSEDIAAQFGAAYLSASTPTISVGSTMPGSYTPASLINAAWASDTSLDMFDSAETGEVLVAGDDFTITFDIVVDPDLIDEDSDYLQNTATISGEGTNYDGSVITVNDQSGADDGTGIDTDEPIDAIVPEIAIVKRAGDAVANGEDWDVPFTLVVENTGSVNLNNLTLFDDIASQFGNAYLDVSGLTVQNFVGSGTAPTNNPGWLGDTTLSMITGGNLDPGDRFEVTFTVTIDPDGIDNVSQALENQATVNGDAVDNMGNPLLDDSGDPLTADDVSDDGANPQGTNPGENGDHGTDADPTPIFIADISVVKAVSGTPSVLSNGNFSVTYELLIENTGTVDLASLTLIEDLAAQFGNQLVSAGGLTLTAGPSDAASNIAINSAWDGSGSTEMIDQAAVTLLAIGDAFMVQFTVEVDPDVSGTSTPMNNQVVVGGDAVDDNGDPINDSNGTPITANDDSDSGTDPNSSNPNDQGDNGTSNDPTPLLIPSIGLAKSSGGAVANGQNWDVTFTLVYENNGTVDLNNLTLFDDIAAQFGTSAVDVKDLTVGNFSGTGTLPTANTGWESDTSQTLISGGQVNIGDSFEISYTVTIDPDASGTSAALDNQATAEGDGIDDNGQTLVDSSGDPLTAIDVSDNGVDANGENGEQTPDGIFGNDPTPIYIADLGIAKSIVGEPQLVDGHYLVTYLLIVENTGTVDLTNLTLTEDLAGQFGAAYVDASSLVLIGQPSDPQSSIALNSSFNGGSNTEMLDVSATNVLQVGDSFALQFVAEVNPNAPGDELHNQVIGSGDAIDENGDPILDDDGQQLVATDFSDGGTDPNSSNPGTLGDTGTWGDTTIFTTPIQSGTSGNPPRFPGLSPIASSSIGRYLTAPGPIYSGIPVASSANPLTLESGRPVTGGYSIDAATDDGECCEVVETIDPCCEETVPVEEVIEGDCGCEPVSEEVCDEVMEVSDECVVDPAMEIDACEELPIEELPIEELPIEDCPPNFLRGPSFLQRMGSWLRR